MHITGRNMYEIAKGIVCAIIATALSTSVAIVRGLLPLNPQWLERINIVAAQMRATSRGQTLDYDDDMDDEFGSMAAMDDHQLDVTQVLAAYQQLWEFSQMLKAKGLGLDEEFCDKIEREWSVSTLLAYVRTADKTLQDSAGEAQDSASRFLLAGGPPQGHA